MPDARETHAQNVRRLTEVSRAFTDATSLKDLLRLVADQAAEMLGAEKAVLLLADEGGLLRVRAACGIPPDVVERFGEAFDESLIGRLRGLLAPESTSGFIGVPLVIKGHVTGLLAVLRADGRPATAAEEWLLSALADQTAAPVENARLAEQLERTTLLADNARLYEAERAARREAETARTEAEAANQAKSEFLATMSHELRTPLNAIGGYVELLEMGIRGPVTDAQREDLRRIRMSQQHLLGLINDVLNFAKLEGGHLHFDLADVPLHETLASVEPLVAPQLRRKGIRYDYAPCDTALTAHVDREKVLQVLLNLLSNAIKFTAPGGRITLACAADDDTVRVTVTDTGCGIPPEKVARVFEPFVRVDSAYTRTTEGTGLGLAISRNLARAMEGDLTVTSVPDEGSSFTLELPRHPDADAPGQDDA